jgi:hypothetical protein
MADEEESEYEKRFEDIRKHEQPKTHHECRCRDCDPLTAMAERAEAFQSAISLLNKAEWHEDDKPSVRETMNLAEWLMYGGTGE